MLAVAMSAAALVACHRRHSLFIDQHKEALPRGVAAAPQPPATAPADGEKAAPHDRRK